MKKRNPKNQKGQFVIEVILVLFLFVLMATLLTSSLRDNNFLGSLVSGPWERIAGMMGSGHWEPLSNAKATGKHPHQRSTSRRGDSF